MENPLWSAKCQEWLRNGFDDPKRRIIASIISRGENTQDSKFHHPELVDGPFWNTFLSMNTIRDLLIGGGSILVSGMRFNPPPPSPVQEFSLSNPQSIAHDMMRVAQDMRIAAVRHEKEMKQMELHLECAGA